MRQTKCVLLACMSEDCTLLMQTSLFSDQCLPFDDLLHNSNCDRINERAEPFKYFFLAAILIGIE